jgi:hypothetical protein
MADHYFHTLLEDHWTRFPASLDDVKLHEAAATHGIKIDSIDREKGVVHFKGSYKDEQALHDILQLWAKENI